MTAQQPVDDYLTEVHNSYVSSIISRAPGRPDPEPAGLAEDSDDAAFTRLLTGSGGHDSDRHAGRRLLGGEVGGGRPAIGQRPGTDHLRNGQAGLGLPAWPGLP